MHPHLDRTMELHTNHPEQQTPCTQQWLCVCWGGGGGGGGGAVMKSDTHLAGPNQFIDNHLHNWTSSLSLLTLLGWQCEVSPAVTRLAVIEGTS